MIHLLQHEVIAEHVGYPSKLENIPANTLYKHYKILSMGVFDPLPVKSSVKELKDMREIFILCGKLRRTFTNNFVREHKQDHGHEKIVQEAHRKAVICNIALETIETLKIYYLNFQTIYNFIIIAFLDTKLLQDVDIYDSLIPKDKINIPDILVEKAIYMARNDIISHLESYTGCSTFKNKPRLMYKNDMYHAKRIKVKGMMIFQRLVEAYNHTGTNFHQVYS